MTSTQTLKYDDKTYKVPILMLSKFQQMVELMLEFKPYLYDINEQGCLSFDELKKAINEKFTEVTESSNITLHSCLKTIFLSMNSDEFDLQMLYNSNKVLNAIDQKTDKNNTKASYYNAIVKAFQLFDLETPQIYYSKIDNCKSIKKDEKYVMTDKESHGLTTIKKNIDLYESQCIDRIKNDPTFYHYQQLMIFYLYTEVPPIRRDYCNMKMNSRKDSVNWIDTKTGIVHMNYYKNVKSRNGGPYTFDISKYPKAWSAFKNFIDIHPNKDVVGATFLLSSKGKDLIVTNNFNRELSKIFFRGCGVDLLRKYFLSKFVKVEDVKAEEEYARIMRHSIRTRNENYIK